MKPNVARDIAAVAADAAGHFAADDGWAMASHVALSFLMATFPFAIFVAALAGVAGQEALAARAADLLFSTWPADVAGPIAEEVRRVVAQSGGGLLTVSAAVAFFLASNGVEAVRTALNRAYRVVEPRSVVFLRLQSLAFVLVAALLALGGVLTSLASYAAAGLLVELVPGLGVLGGLSPAVAFAGSAILVAGALVAAHLWLPAGRPGVGRLWPGIALTLALWLAAAWLFALYIRTFADMAATYAGLAGVVTAIFFLYVVALTLIFGAEVNAALARRRAQA